MRTSAFPLREMTNYEWPGTKDHNLSFARIKTQYFSSSPSKISLSHALVSAGKFVRGGILVAQLELKLAQAKMDEGITESARTADGIL